MRYFHRCIVKIFESHSAAAGHATLRAMNTAAARGPVVAYIALGANLGDARRTVLSAAGQIAHSPHVKQLAVSPLYQTQPIDSSGPDYINAVMKISTTLPAYSLLELLLNAERSAGRERPFHNAPRTLDLDLLLFGSAQISSERLTVPHPRMWARAFVLLPLRDVAPELVSDEALAAVAGQSILKV
jgi:2-amino-4-hydroxy-6-hydroxymethyldihydropteridine diphosphokinase